MPKRLEWSRLQHACLQRWLPERRDLHRAERLFVSFGLDWDDLHDASVLAQLPERSLLQRAQHLLMPVGLDGCDV